MTSRFVFIDDADPSIQYTGPWNRSTDSLADAGVAGPIYLGTQHGVSGAGASLTYTFSGTRLTVFGTSAVTVPSQGSTDPRWECVIDGTRIPNSQPSSEPQNQWSLCNSPALPDTQHTLILRAASTTTPFWVDFFIINPSVTTATNKLTDPEVLFTFTDPAIQYVSGSWNTLPDNTGILAQEVGATMFMSFNGTKATWYGRMMSGFPSGPSTATYSLDGGAPVDFTIQGLLFDWTTKYQQVIFDTGIIPMGSHNLTVKYLGASTPLVLEYMVIQNGDLTFNGNPTPPPAIANPDNNKDDTSQGNSDKHQSNTGTIVGGVIGGIALLALFITVFILFRKLKQRRAKRLAIEIDGSPIMPTSNLPEHAYEVTPFMNDRDDSRAAMVMPGMVSLPSSPSPSATSTFNTASPGSRPLSISHVPGNLGMARMSVQRSMTAGTDDFARMSYMSGGAGGHNSDNEMGYVGGMSGGLDPNTSRTSYGMGTVASGSTSSSGPLVTSSGRASAPSFGGNEKARLVYLDSLEGSRPLTLANADENTALVHHEDSGLRIAVDVPPSYTPQ